jgi:hypothetical protein
MNSKLTTKEADPTSIPGYVMKGQLITESVNGNTRTRHLGQGKRPKNASVLQKDDFGWELQSDRMRCDERSKGNPVAGIKPRVSQSLSGSNDASAVQMDTLYIHKSTSPLTSYHY